MFVLLARNTVLLFVLLATNTVLLFVLLARNTVLLCLYYWRGILYYITGELEQANLVVTNFEDNTRVAVCRVNEHARHTVVS